MPLVSSGGLGVSMSAQNLPTYQVENNAQFISGAYFDFINTTDMKWVA